MRMVKVREMKVKKTEQYRADRVKEEVDSKDEVKHIGMSGL